MHLSPSQDLIVIATTFFLSIVGGITGIGIATIIIPLLLLLGVSFPVSKSLALWINVWIMSLSVYKRWKTINWHLTVPLMLSAFLLAPVGAEVSFLIPEKVQLLFLGTFVVLSALFILFLKPVPLFSGTTKGGFIKLGILVGSFAGFLGGLLGIGGGILANPILIILGLDPLEVTSMSAVMVLLSSLSGWFTYTLKGYFPWKFALPLVIAALLGSYVGNKLSHRFSRAMLRKIVAAFAIVVGIVIFAKAFSL
jgi:uncharacterized membrane protein YfcA